MFNKKGIDTGGGGSVDLLEVDDFIHQSTTNPTITDDANSDFIIGHKWVNTTLDKIFICVDNTAGAAIWVLINNVVTIGIGGNYTEPQNAIDDGKHNMKFISNVTATKDTLTTAITIMDIAEFTFNTDTYDFTIATKTDTIGEIDGLITITTAGFFNGLIANKGILFNVPNVTIQNATCNNGSITIGALATKSVITGCRYVSLSDPNNLAQTSNNNTI